MTLARILGKETLAEELAAAYKDQQKYNKELLDDWEKIQDGDW